MPVSAADRALAERLADAAGAAIRPFFRSTYAQELKADHSPVTEADRAAEAAMRRLLDAEAPGDGVVGEEYGEKPGVTGRRWVLDPIDGTISFMAGRPIFGTLIALVEQDWPVLGIIDQAIIGDRWVGVVGRGTTLNGAPVRARGCAGLATAVLATSSPHYFWNEEQVGYLSIAAKVDRYRIVYGGDCYNYGLLAAGHIDLVVEAGLKLHDFAALAPIVEGAGGRMCDWQGDPLSAASAENGGGQVLAIGDPARVDDVLEALHGGVA